MDDVSAATGVTKLEGVLAVPLDKRTKALLQKLSKSPFWPSSVGGVAAEMIRIYLRELEAHGWFE